MTATEKMLRKRYYKHIPVECLSDELLLDTGEVKKVLSNSYPVIEIADTSNRTFKYISFKTMMEILDVC